MRAVVVIPTYNECDTISGIVEQVLARPVQPDVLVVDDGSPDGTAELVRKAAAAAPGRVDLLERAGKDGLGRAYADGFAHALDGGYDVIVQMDADGSHAPYDVDRLVEATAEADLVIGSRYVEGGSSAGLTGGRAILSRGGNTYARMLLHVGVNDLTGGFKAWRRDLLAELLAQKASASDGYGFQIEMTLRAARHGARIREIPITFYERRAGTSKMNWRIAREAVWKVPWMARHYRADGSVPPPEA